MAGVDIIATAFNGANLAYLADLYARWVANPSSVEASFADLFAALGDDARAVLEDSAGASWAPRSFDIGEPEPTKPTAGKDGKPAKDAKPAAVVPAGPSAADIRAATKDSLRALMMIRTYRVRGHLEAQLDPLGLQAPKAHPELDPATYGFSAADMDRPIFIDHVLGFETATPRQILQTLRRT